MKRFERCLIVLLFMAPACGESQLEGKPSAKVEEAGSPNASKAPESSSGKASKAEKGPAEKSVAPSSEGNKGESLAPSSKVKAPLPPLSRRGDVPDEKSERELVLDPRRSSIAFVGRKVTKDHEGSFSGISGTGKLKGYLPLEFKIAIDMDTLTSDHPKLTNHLKSADFFNTPKYPRARFKTTKIRPGAEGVATHTMSGELSLLAVTKRITFPATIVVTDAGATGLAEFKINRKDFGIVYPGRPDDLISDEVLLKLNLAFLDEKYAK